VTLIGRRWSQTPALIPRLYPKKTFLLFCDRQDQLPGIQPAAVFYLLFKKADAVCAIDLDTILPFYFISKLKRIPRVYDAHELFCEMKEVVTRPLVYKVWKRWKIYGAQIQARLYG
jgi:hypothetical protein